MPIAGADAMQVLVAYASRHGATQGIAERIADTLRASGLEAVARSVTDVRDLGPWDAVVLGSAAYMFDWLGEAKSFAQKHRRELCLRPLWVFSSGPIGTDEVDKDGAPVRDSAVSQKIKDLVADLDARDHHVFYGVYYRDRPKKGLAERFLALMPAARDAFPEGDFRDWDEIEVWARGIAAALGSPAASAGEAEPV